MYMSRSNIESESDFALQLGLHKKLIHFEAFLHV